MKDTVKRIRWQTTDWEKISANTHVTKNFYQKCVKIKQSNYKISTESEQILDQRKYTDGK